MPAPGVDPCAPQHLVGNQVADASKARLIHDPRLHRRVAATENPGQILGRDAARIGPEPGLIGVQLHCTQPARVPHAEVTAVDKPDTEAVPASQFPVAGIHQVIDARRTVDNEAAAHPEVQAEGRAAA